MSISLVGNSDAYARYRQQQLDLLASPSQVQSQSVTTNGQSYVAPISSGDQSSSNPFATKFKTDLTALNQPSDSTSGAHHGHGGHHHHKSESSSATNSTNSTDLTNPSTDPTSTDPTRTDPVDQALNDFANILKAASDPSTA